MSVTSIMLIQKRKIFQNDKTFTCLAISLIQPTPLAKSGKTMEPYFLHWGRGRTFIVTSVTTPSVPEKYFILYM